MLSDSSYGSDEYEEAYGTSRQKQPNKRRKVNKTRATFVNDLGPHLSFDPLLNQLESQNESSFERFIEGVLPEYVKERDSILEREVEQGTDGAFLRPLTRSEVTSLIDAAPSDVKSHSEAIALRKMKLKRERRRAKAPEPKIEFSSGHVTPIPPTRPALPVNPKVIDALYSIQTTPFENSFLSRLSGISHSQTQNPGLIAVDWETCPPWIYLMNDIRAHYVLSHPERDPPINIAAPITYTSLQESHLEQVHDLLARVFWTGINVSDSLQYSPERCTVTATYKRLVVGVAILSSPQETYITYLAVRAGWDNTQIATSMLYHLIALNPNKDITLHVSANNSAMLLYNRFGFKAEEFVAGFYEDYLDPQSRASKNAFRLRLRRQ